MLTEDISAKRRALEPAVDDRLVTNMEQLKSFILDQNKELQNTINKQLQETMESNNKANIKAMEGILNKKLDCFAGYVDTKIESVREECVTKMEELSTVMSDKMSALNNDLDDRIDLLERQSKLCDVVIKNIPYRRDENMKDIVYDICHAIEFKSINAIKSAFRMSSNQNRSNPIVVKFYDVDGKRDFMYGYFQHQQLNMGDVGFHTKQRIIICEALSRRNNEIFKKAMELKFNKVFWSVSTKNGLVYYRLEQKSRPSKISSLSSLNAFIPTGTSENGRQKERKENEKEMGQSNDLTADQEGSAINNFNDATNNPQKMVITTPNDVSADGI